MRRDADILAVHRATAADPSAPGEAGTEGLRRSADPFDAALTLSVVFRRRLQGRVQGVGALDLECSSERQYFTLLLGFELLRKHLFVGAVTDALSEKQRRAEAQWSPRPYAQPPPPPPEDPVSLLFTRALDPWRMAGLGGAQACTGALPPERFLGWDSKGTQVWARLHMAGLEVRALHSWDLASVVLKVRCPEWRLEEMAERLRMRLRARGKAFKRFRIADRDLFAEQSSGSLFSSSERQYIIDRVIKSKVKDGGAELGEGTALGRHIDQRFPLHMAASLEALRESWVCFWSDARAQEPWSLYATPVGESMRRAAAVASAAWTGALAQPLDSVEQYYGQGVGFLFAFMAFYTRWLIAPSLLGLVVFAVQVRERRLDHWLCLPYAVYIMVWASFMLTYWRQKQSVLAYRWGVLEFEADETERPQFVGRETRIADGAEVRKVFPAWRRVLRYLVSAPLLAVTILAILCVMISLFSTQDRLLREYVRGDRSFDFAPSAASISSTETRHSLALQSNGTATAPLTFSLSVAEDPTFWVIAFFYPSLYSILIYASAKVCDFLSEKLNDFENHRTQSTYLNRLILKVFSFRFIAVFTNLYWYAFTPSQDAGTAYIRVAVVMFCLLTVGSWGEAFMDACLPALYQRVLMYRLRRNVSLENRRLYRAKEHDDETGNARREAIERKERLLGHARSSVWDEACQVSYTTFADYSALVVQFGLIIFFAAIFPLAPLIALLNNLVMIRLRAYKICYTMQRPLSHKCSGVGVWEDILQIMSVMGVLTNLALFGLTSDVLREHLSALGSVGVAVLLFVFEHAMLFFKYWLYTSIPKVPSSVLRLQMNQAMTTTKAKDSRRRTKAAAKADDAGDFNGRGGGGSVALLAPLTELLDDSQFVDVDPAAREESSPLAPRQRSRTSVLSTLEPLRTQLSDAEPEIVLSSDDEDSFAMDSSDSDNYVLASPSRSALVDSSAGWTPPRPSAAGPRTTDSAAEDARFSISTRLRNFQAVRRNENSASKLAAVSETTAEENAVNYSARAVAAPAPRKSLLSLLGWESRVGELSLEQKLQRVEVLLQSPKKAGSASSQPSLVPPPKPPKSLLSPGSSRTSAHASSDTGLPRGVPTSSPRRAAGSPKRAALVRSPPLLKAKKAPAAKDPSSLVRSRLEAAKNDVKFKMRVPADAVAEKTANPFGFAQSP